MKQADASVPPGVVSVPVPQSVHSDTNVTSPLSAYRVCCTPNFIPVPETAASGYRRIFLSSLPSRSYWYASYGPVPLSVSPQAFVLPFFTSTYGFNPGGFTAWQYVSVSVSPGAVTDVSRPRPSYSYVVSSPAGSREIVIHPVFPSRVTSNRFSSSVSSAFSHRDWTTCPYWYDRPIAYPRSSCAVPFFLTVFLSILTFPLVPSCSYTVSSFHTPLSTSPSVAFVRNPFTAYSYDVFVSHGA
ncbi:MAG: hypothetical protein DIJKHBIC_00549 [Thermoanaerobaculia bacterium]|nr:hypothetical protein [Thermoanaerobaculia bacterium]